MPVRPKNNNAAVLMTNVSRLIFPARQAVCPLPDFLPLIRQLQPAEGQSAAKHL
jgi:hypothetical protein